MEKLSSVWCITLSNLHAMFFSWELSIALKRSFFTVTKFLVQPSFELNSLVSNAIYAINYHKAPSFFQDIGSSRALE